jgi:hypothetical protein
MLRFRDGFGCVEGVMTDMRERTLKLKRAPEMEEKDFTKTCLLLNTVK